MTYRPRPGRRSLLAAAPLLWGCAAAEVEPEGSTRYLDAAVRVGEWMTSLAPDGGPVPDRLDRPGASPGLGSGAAGRALFLAALFDATSEPAFRAAALREATSALSARAAIAGDHSLYGGLAGLGFAVVETGALVGDSGLVAAGRRILLDVAAARPGLGGGGWGTVNDVIGGTAGVGLALLDAHRRFGDEAFLEAAIEAGDTLLARAERPAEGRLRWLRGADAPFDLPNFSHGTAGVGFFLLRLGTRTGLDRFASASLDAIRYLDAVADTTGGLLLVPYGVPNEGYVTRYAIGWAHGPPGTARIHYLAWRAGDDAAMRAAVVASARTLQASGVPAGSADSTRWAGPFRTDRRFGASGAASFLFDVARETGDATFAGTGFAMVDTLLARATTDDAGTRWSVPLYGFQDGEGDAVFTGFFYGAAGFGLTLLDAHHALLGSAPRVRLPDDPFGAGPVG